MLPVRANQQISVQPHSQKYSGSLLTQITSTSTAVPSSLEGRFAIVTNVGYGMRWTRMALLTRALSCGRRSRVVLTPRRWRQVGERNFTGDGGNKARSPWRAPNKLLKPSRAGMPGDPGATVVTNACAFYHCARGCGCNGHPAFPTPSLGGSIMHNSGDSRRGNAKLYLRAPDAAQHAALGRGALLIRGP
jgi:hypothetical protein